jgi:carbonic anhydrase
VRTCSLVRRYASTISLAALVALSGCEPAETGEQVDLREDSEPHAPDLTSRLEVHWGYEGQEGPEHWAELSPEFELCASGAEQSPIDIADAVPAERSAHVFDYAEAPSQISHMEHVVDLLDNGHTLQVTYDEGSSAVLGGKMYNLAQFHFHAPSEHTRDGRRYPMEIHFVHQAEDGELAVLGAFIEEGARHNAFDSLWVSLPAPGQGERLEGVQVDVDAFLPEPGPYYRYEGSLTTPPCSEGVHWFIDEAPIELAADQIDAFAELLAPNNRPLQPTNDRVIALADLE